MTNDLLGVQPNGAVGLRINPLVGEGRIAALSTATSNSKFGVPLTNHTKPEIIQLYRSHSFLNGIMCHVGSQVSISSKPSHLNL
jgi:diaminopimelate decarboxylase